MGKKNRAPRGRRDRRQLPPLGLGSAPGRSYYAAVVNVVEMDDPDDVRWLANISGDPSEQQQIAPRSIAADTLAELWYEVHNELQEIGDEVDNTVGTKWMLDGDTEAWMELADRERLADVPIGVPGGLPTYMARVRPD